jgi:hypothetical protein
MLPTCDIKRRMNRSPARYWRYFYYFRHWNPLAEGSSSIC